MDELMKQLKALADSIAAISGRIDALEKARGSAGDMDALKAEMTKQKDEVTAILAKVQREGITGLDAKGAKRAEAIAAFVGAVRGNLSAVTRTSSNEGRGILRHPRDRGWHHASGGDRGEHAFDRGCSWQPTATRW